MADIQPVGMTTHALMELADLLRDCEKKLRLYHEATNGEYPGGPPMQTLLPRIEKAATQLRTAAAEGGDGAEEIAGRIVNELSELKRGDPDNSWCVIVHVQDLNRIAARHIQPLLAQPTDSGAGRDGERYRWLRKQQWSDAHIFVVVGGKSRVKLGTNCPSYNLLDTAIDTAIAGAAGEG